MNCDATKLAPIRSTSLAAHLTAFALWLFCTASLMAQSTSMPEGIVARGSSGIGIPPTALRLTMTVKAQGKDAKTAIRSLAEHKKRLSKELGEMNAKTETIEFASTQLGTGGNDNSEQRQYIQMMRMMQQQMGGASIDADSIPSVYTATASLRVEWPLPTSDADALALLPQGLKDQIKERDFAGSNNKPDLDEESLEKLEEAQSMAQSEYGFGMEEDGASGPNIVFVGKPSQEQRSEAMKSAIQKARQSAETTAAALETKLGKLKTVWPTESSSSDSSTSYGAYMMSDLYSSGEEESSDEVTATTADGLRIDVSVFAVYGFE